MSSQTQLEENKQPWNQPPTLLVAVIHHTGTNSASGGRASASHPAAEGLSRFHGERFKL